VPDPSNTIELTDPRALRAVAHPIRLKLVGLLRREGPLTATRAGEFLDESPASCSFHLRQLAKYGLVEEAGGGRGRERPWRATALFTSWPGATPDPELAAASDLLSRVVAERYFEQLMRWVDMRADEPADWQEAEVFGDRMLYLTSAELAELGRELDALLDRYVERTAAHELRPEGSRLVTFIRAAFPHPDEG
jgi:predicted ArsR family transcriptional regulator